MHALAPIAYIHDMKSPLFRTLVLFLDFLTVSYQHQQFDSPILTTCVWFFYSGLQAATRMLRITEFMPNTKFLVDHSQVVCHDNAMTQDVCSNILFLVAGYNSEQLNKVMWQGQHSCHTIASCMPQMFAAIDLNFASHASCLFLPQLAKLPSDCLIVFIELPLHLGNHFNDLTLFMCRSDCV